MALFTKSILSKPLPTDGIRISIMSRHTLSDGVTPDTRITKDLFNEHLPALAPSPKLLGDYYKRGLSWNDFETRFKQELETPKKVDALHKLAQRAVKENITLLCIENTDECCHRRLILEKCKAFEIKYL